MDCNVPNSNRGQTYPDRRINHYFIFHKILLVGEGDFSFSSALANAFGFAGNMVATSLDSREKVVSSYKSSPEGPCKSGQENLQTLERLGARTLHNVDVTTMDKLHSLRGRKFDIIVYNFPHAGFFGFNERDQRVVNMHRHLVKMFFKNARTMLKAKGEIHVTHQERPPYNQWKLTELAEECGLHLKGSVEFKKSDYPGYTNRRGAGLNIGDTFSIGDCRTYMYIQREAMGTIIVSLQATILKLESEKENIAKQLCLKEDEIKKKDIRFTETLLKFDFERQARKAAETAKVELEASLNHLKTLADEAQKEISEFERIVDSAGREKTNLAKQLSLKEDKIKQNGIRFTETLLKLDIERQAREAAETAKAELEASLIHFQALADEAPKENSELERQRELVFYQMDSAWREDTYLAKQLSLKEDEIKKNGIRFTETLLKLDIERQARKAAETAKSELEASFNNFKLSAIRQMNQLERQRNDALYQKEEVCREIEKTLRGRNDPIQIKWSSYSGWIWKLLAIFWGNSGDREMESRADLMNV